MASKDAPPGSSPIRLPDGQYLRRAATFLRPYRRRALGILLFAVTVAVVNAMEPLILKWIFDSLTAGGPWRNVLLGIGLLLGAAALREGVGAVASRFVWGVRLGVHQDLLDATLQKIHTLPVDFHRREGVGGLITRLDRSISGFLQAVQELGQSLLPGVVYLVLALWVMFALDWRLSLVVLALTPLPVLIARWAAPEQAQRERELMERWVGLYSRFNQVLTGIVTVRSFVMEEEEKRRFMTGVEQANRVVRRGVARDSGVGAAKNFSAALARVAAVAVGGLLVLRGEITVGTLVAFLGYVGGLFGPVQGLTGVYATLRRASVSIETIFSILDTPDPLGDAPDAVPLEGVRGDVSFEDVHFAYPEQAPVLRGLTLEVPAGQRVALVGPSGSGKSTAMSLLQRFYDPDRGAVRLDGLDLRKVRQRDLRRSLGVVLQEPLLFRDTVRANIAYGRPGADPKRIEQAARAAQAHGFIQRLPEGYDTDVGERGSRLSVGERQRVAIARALLKDPPVLILDEPTAALDAESESLIQEALDVLTRGRTTFVIAHRLATVVDMDRIVVLREGRVVEDGTHEELLDRGGYYASLVHQQVEGLLPQRVKR